MTSARSPALNAHNGRFAVDANAKRPPVPEQVSPSCYYGVPTNDETLELLAGSWYLSLSPSLTLT